MTEDKKRIKELRDKISEHCKSWNHQCLFVKEREHYLIHFYTESGRWFGTVAAQGVAAFEEAWEFIKEYY